MDQISTFHIFLNLAYLLRKNISFPKCPKITQKFTQNRKTLVNEISKGVWCCLKRERDIGRKAMLSNIKTAITFTPALKYRNMNTTLKTSAYEVKSNSCLFERFFKVKKNGISFFVLESFTFLYYANEVTNDVTDHSTKTVQHSIKNISGNIKAVFLKLGTRNVHSQKKQNDSCHAVAMTTVMPLALF